MNFAYLQYTSSLLFKQERIQASIWTGGADGEAMLDFGVSTLMKIALLDQLIEQGC